MEMLLMIDAAKEPQLIKLLLLYPILDGQGKIEKISLG